MSKFKCLNDLDEIKQGKGKVKTDYICKYTLT